MGDEELRVGAEQTEERLGNGNRAKRGDGEPHDTGDESSRGDFRYQQLAQADAARNLLNQVRDALDRIDSGSFGRCAEDGEPIDEARLEAVPWSAYCERHDRRQPPMELVANAVRG